MMVENIDPEDGSVFVSNTDWQKKQWISHEDFINITDLKVTTLQLQSAPKKFWGQSTIF